MLSEKLQITNKASEEIYEQLDKEMFVALAPVMINNNRQAVIPKNIVPDPEWFNRDKTKFEDWWRGIQLFLKNNRIMETDNKITMILAHLREDIVGIYGQKKLNELDKELETQDWNEFVKEIKTTFSDKIKTVDVE